MRATAPAEVYLEILGQAGFGDFDDFAKHLAVGTPVPGSMGEALRAYASKQDQELPNDEDPFDLYSLPSVGDGDFPPSPQLLMHDLLPNDVVVLGEIRETTFNGTFVEFSPDRADEILGLLKRMGYTCVNDQPLIEAQPFQD
jgi:hypothetical protein